MDRATGEVSGVRLPGGDRTGTPSAPSSRGGFTLLEVIVAVTVAALALLSGLVALSFVRERTRAVDEALAETLEAAAVRDLLIEWLAAATPTMPAQGVVAESFIPSDPLPGMAGESFQGIAPGVEGDPNSVLIFPTRAQTPLGVPYTLVRLYIDLDPATPESGLVAELSEGLGGPDAQDGGDGMIVFRDPSYLLTEGLRAAPRTRRVELVPGATRLTIQYLNQSEAQGISEWLDDWLSSTELPQGVVIQIDGDVPDAVPPLLRHPIRVRLW